MSEPFLSEIKIMSFGFPPKGWALCNGQFLPINQNQALFALLGTTYGGNGQTTFALPNLQGRTPIHVGNGHTLGESAGADANTITQQTMPTHTHLVNASTTTANSNVPTGKILANSRGGIYAESGPLVALDSRSGSTSVGGSQAHENRQPYTTLNFCIALQGIFPSQN
ncbi:MAG: phage tail protein [Chloroflexota bacterium]|nr:MAG: phage tail protein [Chloroflexota bacterium]